jgi:hypothetical protein
MGVDGHMWRNHFHCKHIKTAAQYRATLLYVEQNPTAAGVVQKAHLYEYSSAPAHCKNEPLYELAHRHHRARVKLYLTRWRREFNTPQDWPEWLRSPRDAAHQAELTEIERVLGADRKRPQKQTALPPIVLPAQAAGQGTAHRTTHGWTRQ